MNMHMTPQRRVPDPRTMSDSDRLERCIAALTELRKAASCGLMYASDDGLVALEATRRLWQSDDLDTLYQEVWAEAGCPLSDEIDAKVRSLDVRRVG